MKKRIASLVLAALMVLVSVPAFTLATAATEPADYTYTTSWQKNMPQFKFVEGAADAERVDVSDAWSVGWYNFAEATQDTEATWWYENYKNAYYEGANTVHVTTKNISVGIFSAPTYAHPYMMQTMTGYNNGYHYKAEYDGVVDISIDSLNFVGFKSDKTEADPAVQHVFAVFHNGKMIWPTADGDFFKDADWWTTTKAKENVAADVAAHDNASALKNITVKKGDSIDFIFSWNDACTKDSYDEQRCNYSFDASVNYKNVALAEEANITSATINGQTVYYDAATNLIRTGDGKTGGQVAPTAVVGAPTYFNEDQFKADAEAVATYGTFRDYLLAHGKYAWDNANAYYTGWSAGTAYLSKEVGNFAENNRLVFMNRTLMEIADKWYSQSASKCQWLVPEDVFESFVDQYLAGEMPDVAQEPVAASDIRDFSWIFAYDDAIFVQQWISNVSGVAQFKNHSELGYAAGATAGSKLCIVIDNEVVYPAGATWSDTSSWYSLTDANGARKSIAVIDEEMANFRALVAVGSKVQICYYRETTFRNVGSSNGDYPFRMAYQMKVNPVLANIEDTSVSIGDDLAMNYFVRVAKVAADAEVGVVYNDVFYAGEKIEDGLYKATTPGIPAKDAAGELVAYPAIKTGDVIVKGDPYVGSIAVRLAQYNVPAYDAKVQNLAVAALNYIAAAQKFFAVEEDAANLYIKPALRTVSVTGTYESALALTQGTTVTATGINLSLMGNVSFLLEAKASDDAAYTATISDGTNTANGEIRKVADGQYRIVFSDIAPTAWNTNYTITVTNNADATDVLSVTYSVATYAVRTASNANVKAVTDAMLAYYEAAVAYNA